MRTLSWGQSVGSICQFAFVVADLEAAIEEFRGRLKSGPWFVFEHFKSLDSRYHGEPTNVDVSVAIAFNGQTCVELIQQHNDVPSAWRDGMKNGRFGFHHFGIAVDDFEAELKRHLAEGGREEFSSIIAGGRIAYLDRPGLPGMIELIEATPAVEELFGMMCRSAENWDGRDPIRRLAVPA
jgi:catechol 2,3-dioxygenase-like lactoylglutathione lyase family enzyme